MSAVRMCDRCGNIFAEGAEGSSVGSMTRNIRGRDEVIRPQTVAADLCPKCSVGDTVVPRLSLTRAEYKGDTVDLRE